jgi:hypothetical protein
MAVWGGRGASALFEVPLTAAVRALADRGIDAAVPPDDAGPFSLGDAAAVTSLLERAGWRDVAWTPVAVRLPVGGGCAPEEAADVSLQLGPTRIVTKDLAPDDLAAVRVAVAERLSQHVDDSGHVVLDATLGIVTARR